MVKLRQTCLFIAPVFSARRPRATGGRRITAYDSPLVGDIRFTNGSTLRMTTSKSCDYLNRLTAMDSRTGVAPVSSFMYLYNHANQRTRTPFADGGCWNC